MFYSHEVLTSRKYGVATVWLVATLGAKSNNTKKISRKAILDVSVKKACLTIEKPDAPMALRLQSNLLYGVSRVYDQQCGYVLQDAQSAQNALRSLIKSSRSNQLDLDAGKARPEQLLLMDDPAFLADNALPALDFDFDLPSLGDSQRSTQSMMSIRNRSGSASSRASSVLGINLPSSSGNSSYQLPNLDQFGNTPIHKNYGGQGRDLEEEQFMDEDNIFQFNEDGELLELPPMRSDGLRYNAILPGGHRPSDSAASGRVRKEHEDGFGGAHIAGEDDYMMQFGDDDMGILPDADPFGPGDLPLMAGGLGGDDQPQYHSSQDRVLSEPEAQEEESEESVSAQAPQKKRLKKKLTVDTQLSVTSSDVKLWISEYATRMAAANLVKEHQKANTQAKKNAFYFVFGGGLNGVGSGIGLDKMASPLDMFAGESLRALITGNSPLAVTLKKGTKRPSEEGSSPPAKRPRDSELGRGGSPRNDIVLEDGGAMNIEDDHSQSIEFGRDAGSAIPDHPSSALMPWNKSASLHSHQRNASSQHGRAGMFGSQLGSLGHRLASASPLIGRGTNLAGDMEHLAMMDEDDVTMYGRDDGELGSVGLDFGAGGGTSSSQGVGGGFNSQLLRSHEEFQIFGQAANVDTQTAGTSQWVRDALDTESNNFFEYVRNTIEEKRTDEIVDEEVEEHQKSVTFEELFNVEANTAIVAAQAFYHVLCLATKRRVWVEQERLEDEVGEPAPFGEIKISIVEMNV